MISTLVGNTHEQTAPARFGLANKDLVSVLYLLRSLSIPATSIEVRMSPEREWGDYRSRMITCM